MMLASYEYNTRNLLSAVRTVVQSTDPAVCASTDSRLDTRLWSYEYDDGWNLNKVVDANGNGTPADPNDGTTLYGYDAIGRLETINYSDTTPDVSFTYDANSNRTQMTDTPLVVVPTDTYAYDALNRLTSVTRGSDVFSYRYDRAGNVTRRTYPDATLVDYTYDDDERLQTAASGGYTSTYGYDASANQTSLTLPNVYVESRTFDRAGRLTEVKSTKPGITLARHTYTLDPVGNPEKVVTPTSTTHYKYDSMDRLTKECSTVDCTGVGNPIIAYGYDEVGNRATETRPGASTSYSYNVRDELEQKTATPGGTTAYAYDRNGNETGAGATVFTYDLANRLKTADVGLNTLTYHYDGDSKRLQMAMDADPLGPQGGSSPEEGSSSLEGRSAQAAAAPGDRKRLERILAARRASLRNLLSDVTAGQLTPEQCEELREAVAEELAIKGLDKAGEPTGHGKQLDTLIGWLGSRKFDSER